ncbi:GTP 3',8-cyclase MoaA [Mycoplasmatota bacterium WC44]
MKDSFNREIDYIRISVTDRCNLRCLYCMPDGVEKITHEAILRDEEIIELVKEGVKIGIKKVRITGGEPLVRRGIYSLIRNIKDIEGIKELTLTTNGLLLEGKVDKLKEAGVDRVNLSLDSLKPEKLKKVTNSTETIDYIKLIEDLRRYGITPIKINTVLLKGINDDEINDFLKLSKEHDLIIRFIELMPIGHLNFSWVDHYLSNDHVLKECPELKIFREDKNTVYYATEGQLGMIGLINPISHKFCGSCNRIRLTADGKLKPCLHTNQEINVKSISNIQLKAKLRKVIMDKPKNHKIKDKSFTKVKRSMNRIGG